MSSTTFLPVAELTRRVLQGPVRRSLIPEEHLLSLWVPLLGRDGSAPYLTAFFYESPSRRGTPRPIHRPSRQIVVDPANARLVLLTDCAFQDFATGVTSEEIVGQVGPGDVPARSIAELQALQERLYRAYDHLLGVVFQPAETLSTADRADLVEFKTLFQRLTEPGLTPFYRSLNPVFWEWLDRMG